MEDEVRQDAKKKRKLLIWVLIGVAVFVCIILPVCFLTGLSIVIYQGTANRTPTAVVPNVVGLEYRKGELLLKEKGLKMKVLAVRSDQNQPVGIILSQTPPAGESLDVRRAVAVTIGGKAEPGPTLERR
jgi:beta-lactam-binding protein with PASTA domain